MKRIFIASSLFLAFFAFATANAADGAALYKSCAGCHGADGNKSSAGSAIIKGETSAALFEKMNGYVKGTYGGKQKAIMTNIMKKHTEEEMKTLADYISKL